MRSVVLLILFAVVTAASVQFAEEWDTWKSLHGRNYPSEKVGVKGRGEGVRGGGNKGGKERSRDGETKGKGGQRRGGRYE